MLELKAARSAGLFASPLLEHVWSDGPELNPRLRECILDHAQRHPGTAQTNVGGWHSDTGTLEFCGDAGQRLMQHMRDATEEATRRLYAAFSRPAEPARWILSAWANVAWPGNSNAMHTHPGATWSGVNYVDHGDSNPTAAGACIELIDPNAARANVFFPELSCQSVLFRPQPGLMILFPSYVPHAVPPHQGDRPRISIAFNVRKNPFP